MSTFEMLDTITPGSVKSVASSSFEALAGYVAGSWPDYNQMVKLYPHDHHLSITPTSADAADVLDIETGDSAPADAPAWVKRQHARGLARPVLYANRSTMPAVVGELVHGGLNRDQYLLWVADWTDVPHIPEGYDACQWTCHYAGQNLDASDVYGYFFNELNGTTKAEQLAKLAKAAAAAKARAATLTDVRAELTTILAELKTL